MLLAMSVLVVGAGGVKSHEVAPFLFKLNELVGAVPDWTRGRIARKVKQLG